MTEVTVGLSLEILIIHILFLLGDDEHVQIYLTNRLRIQLFCSQYDGTRLKCTAIRVFNGAVLDSFA